MMGQFYDFYDEILSIDERSNSKNQDDDRNAALISNICLSSSQLCLILLNDATRIQDHHVVDESLYSVADIKVTSNHE